MLFWKWQILVLMISSYHCTGCDVPVTGLNLNQFVLQHPLPPHLWSYLLYCCYATSYRFLCKCSQFPGEHGQKRQLQLLWTLTHKHANTHTQTYTHTQCHLESEWGNSWMIFIVIHVLIYSVMADVKQGCNMQMWVCFSMGIFRSTASSCH